MRRRKFRERRNSAWERKWLQRELEASGIAINIRAAKVPDLPPSTTSFELIAVTTAPPIKRHRPRNREVSVFN